MSAADNGLVVVTGAGTGIGRATAIRLSRSGHYCLLVGQQIDKLEETTKMILDQGGCGVTCLSADVTTEEGRSKILETLDKEKSRIWGLVNNAGGSYLAPLFSQDLSKWRYNVSLNLESVAFLSFEVMRRMRKEGGGSIVNISSVYGIVSLRNEHYGECIPAHTPDGPVRGVSYAASKGGVRSLTRELAVAGCEMGIRVNAVCPGMIPRDESTLDESAVDNLRRSTPLGRLGRPDEIANVVNFLISSEASFVTGAEVVADGGWTLW